MQAKIRRAAQMFAISAIARDPARNDQYIRTVQYIYNYSNAITANRLRKLSVRERSQMTSSKILGFQTSFVIFDIPILDDVIFYQP